MSKQFALMTLVIGLLAVSFAAAEVPKLINYQGNLTDSEGNPVADGDYNMVFTIYDSESSPTGIWYSGIQSVHVENGAFSYFLGSVNPLPDTLFNDTLRWLGIKVGSDPEIDPRTRLVTVPYAFQVGTIDGASGGSIYGNVGINTDSAAWDLHIAGPGPSICLDDDGEYRYHLSFDGINFSISQGNPTSAWTRFTIDTEGNTRLVPAGGTVEIGGNAEEPAARLYIQGHSPDGNNIVRLEPALGFSEPYISFWYDHYNEGARIQASNDVADGASLRFHTVESSTLNERMRITAGGNVAIGTDSPSSTTRFTVHSSGTDRAGYFQASGQHALETYNNVQAGTPNAYGVTGHAAGGDGAIHGVYGLANGSSSNGYGVLGYAHTNVNYSVGVMGRADSQSGSANYHIGVYGNADHANVENTGVYASAAGADATNYGVYASASGGTTNYAGYFDGDVHVTGTLTGGKAGIPSGGIIMWSGQADNIPDGWVLCDGSKGTPNLTDRFILADDESGMPQYLRLVFIMKQ